MSITISMILYHYEYEYNYHYQDALYNSLYYYPKFQDEGPGENWNTNTVKLNM